VLINVGQKVTLRLKMGDKSVTYWNYDHCWICAFVAILGNSDQDVSFGGRRN